MNKKAFSFVELIVVITIIILLGVIVSTVNTNFKTKTLNTRSTADLSTLENAFNAYLGENATLPSPTGNTNYFKEDTSYADGVAGSFGVYGQVTGDTLPNQYLNFLPLDQFTGAFYAYGKLTGKNEFEVAGVIREAGNAISIVKGNYSAESGPYNLIREYNGPNFVYDGSSTYFPYNPEELALNARITELSSGVTGYQVNQVLEAGDSVVVPAGQSMTLYFADGSKSVLGDSVETKLTIDSMSHPNDNSLISQIALILDAGTIWTNATQMGAGSEFTINSGDTTAAIRGTIFGIKHGATPTIDVESGTVTATGGINAAITSGSPDDSTLTAADDKIKAGYGELTSTLKTEVVSYDAQNNTVILKMNDVFKYDAEYLKVGDNTTTHRNTNTWDTNNTGEQSFDLSSFSGNELTLAFCKALNGGEVCTRETSVAKDLSYITEEVNGTIVCSATSNTQNGRTYSLSSAPEGFNIPSPDTYEETDTTDHVVYTYSLTATCESGGLFTAFNETQDFARCETGYPIQDGSSCRAAYACTTSTPPLSGYKFTGNVAHDTPGAVKKLTGNPTGVAYYTSTATCYDNTLTALGTPIATCNTGYDPDGSNCSAKTFAGAYTSQAGYSFTITPAITYGAGFSSLLTSEEKVNVEPNKNGVQKLRFELNADETITEANSDIVLSCNNGADLSNNCVAYLACNLGTSGWKYNGGTEVPHSPATPKNLIKDVSGSNYLVKYEGSTTCDDGNFAFPDAATSYKYTQYTNVTPGTQLSALPQNLTVDLSGNFKISIDLATIPSGSKQYLLFESDLKLSFEPNEATGGVNVICIANSAGNINSAQQCISSSKNIVFERKAGNKIFLNGSETTVVLSTNYSSSLLIGGLPFPGFDLQQNTNIKFE